MEYDVCLSFAGEDRPYVDRVAAQLRDIGLKIFYDREKQVDLWGKDLYQHLDDVYRNRARLCVLFVSASYAVKPWPKHELASAQARALRERMEYLLPARFDDTELPGLSPTIGYVDLRGKEPEILAKLIVEKLESIRHSETSDTTAQFSPRHRLFAQRRIFVASGGTNQSNELLAILDRLFTTERALQQWQIDSLSTEDSRFTQRLRKIRESRAVIAILANRRFDVLFEIGVAIALGRPLMFVTDTPANTFTPWFAPCGNFTSSDAAELLIGMSRLLSQRARTTHVVPSRIVWLRDQETIEDEGLREICDASDLTLNVLHEQSSQLLHELARASFLIIDNSRAAASLAAGMLAARPYAGTALRPMHRCLILRSGKDNRFAVPWPSKQILRRARTTPMADCVRMFAASYRKWVTV